jgi:hypothetical protein
MQSNLIIQAEIDRCKVACRNYFEHNDLSVAFDQPIAVNVEWTPHVYARNNERYGVDIKTEPALEPFWLDTYRINVKPNQPALEICLAFPFEIALRLPFDTLRSFVEEELSIIVIYDDNTLDFFRYNQSQVPSRIASSIIQQLKRKKAEMLSQELRNCTRGRDYFSEYEKVCLAIFKTLFVPPLGEPVTQSSTVSHLRRRDHVFPNRAREGFWHDVVKQTYKGTYVLIECKNLTTKVNVKAIDDAAKYLNKKGVGLFGLVLSRESANPNARRLQISHWSNEEKLIVVLDDNDMLALVERYRNQQDPSVIIQNRIDELMLGVE